MSTFDYIASGPGHTRFTLNEFRGNEEAMSRVNEMLAEVQGKHSHHFSILFNAFQEQKFGSILEETKMRDNVYSIHSDSGGLQIVTQGKTATQDMKRQIYDVQGRYSDYAMSFDEIPVVLPSGRSERNDTSNRFFDKDRLEHFARMTGQNMKDQLEYFVKHDLKAKPLLIVQGNSKEVMQQWADYCLDEIPLELQGKIGGYASGSAVLGNGPLEDIERAFYSTRLELPEHIKSYLHVLGVGAIKRIMPIVLFKRGGLLDNTRISYDSSTHTSGLTYGSYYTKQDGYLYLTRQKDPAFLEMCENIRKMWSHRIDFDLEEILSLVSLSTSDAWNKFAESNPSRIHERYVATYAYFLGSVMNFTHDVEQIHQTGNITPYFNRVKEAIGYAHLERIKTDQDFSVWLREVGRHLESKRVQELNSRSANLEEFF